MRKILSLALFLFVMQYNCKCQDTATKKPVFEADAEFWDCAIFHPFNAPIHEDRYLQRSPTYLNSLRLIDTVRDSPLKHNSFYAALKTTTSLAPGLKIKVDLYGEHRGMSYGMYNTKTVVVYPIIQVQLKDSVTFLKQKIVGEARAGDFLNHQLDEGLLIYNIDLQGGEASLSSGKWKAGFGWFGDLSAGIGLVIDDLGIASLRRTLGRQNKTTVGVSIVAAAPPGGDPVDFLYYNAFFSHSFNKVRLYAQAAIESSHNKGSYYNKGIGNQSAFVVGATAGLQSRNVSLTNKLEVRYYGNTFNFNHTSRRIRYRDTAGAFYANNVGDYLYPLRKYETPFSQWAVYTEYFTCDVWGASLTGNIKVGIGKKTEAMLDYDFNYISAAENRFYNDGLKSQILYSFFTAGYYYKAPHNFRAGVMLTNKGMNLNKSYPALYQYQTPYLGLKISRTI